MSDTLERAASVLVLLFFPFVLTGLITRVKSLWSGRRGAPILQGLWDVVRLLRKKPVYARVTTPVFRVAPWVALVAAAAPALVVPVLGSGSVLGFSFDFVVLAYAWGLGRVALVLGALDTGSSFEGMGAAREATFSTLVEPAWFLLAGALCLFTHSRQLHEALQLEVTGGASATAWVGAVIGFFVLLQAETARMPVDDPTTHLELTMIHEVMVLDHSGPELAAISWANGLKLVVGASFVATLLNPFSGEHSLRSAVVQLALLCAVAVALGAVESLVARLRMRAVPQYLAVALVAGVIALLGATWRLEVLR